MGLRVKEFNETDKNDYESVVGQLEQNWPEMQLRISKLTKEDSGALRIYFNDAGAECWPFNNMEKD